jgi:hypothetical protein
MRHVLAALVLLTACGDDDDAPPSADASTFQAVWTHDFPSMQIAAGEEIDGLCQSWTVGNDEPLYVNRVELTAGPGWHHSNWLYVPDDAFPGEDGIWPCHEREFDQVSAGIQGGVLTAQSTQAQLGVQQFEPGHALVMPAHARIIGATHALNAGDGAVDTRLGLRLEAIPYANVTTRLHGLSFQNRSIALPPMAHSRFSTRCDLAAKYDAIVGNPIDFHIYYVLPHYHALGEGLTLQAVGGPKDGQVIFQNDSPVGEPGGGPVEPPYDLTGATGLRMTCAFANPRDEVVRWGIGDQEMCVLLAFTDAPVVIAGGVQPLDANVPLGQDEAGVYENDAPCEPFLFIARDE